MENSFVVDCKGLSRGIAFLWKERMKATLISYSNLNISLKVAGEKEGKDWLLTSFYGDPMTSRRMDSWKLLRNLQLADQMALCAWETLTRSYINMKSLELL